MSAMSVSEQLHALFDDVVQVQELLEEPNPSSSSWFQRSARKPQCTLFVHSRICTYKTCDGAADGRSQVCIDRLFLGEKIEVLSFQTKGQEKYANSNRGWFLVSSGPFEYASSNPPPSSAISSNPLDCLQALSLLGATDSPCVVREASPALIEGVLSFAAPALPDTNVATGGVQQVMNLTLDRHMKLVSIFQDFAVYQRQTTAADKIKGKSNAESLQAVKELHAILTDPPVLKKDFCGSCCGKKQVGDRPMLPLLSPMIDCLRTAEKKRVDLSPDGFFAQPSAPAMLEVKKYLVSLIFSRPRLDGDAAFEAIDATMCVIVGALLTRRLRWLLLAVVCLKRVSSLVSESCPFNVPAEVVDQLNAFIATSGATVGRWKGEKNVEHQDCSVVPSICADAIMCALGRMTHDALPRLTSMDQVPLSQPWILDPHAATFALLANIMQSSDFDATPDLMLPLLLVANLKALLQAGAAHPDFSAKSALVTQMIQSEPVLEGLKLESANQPEHGVDAALDALPAGWSKGVSSGGKAYYINHFKKITSWDPPPTDESSSNVVVGEGSVWAFFSDYVTRLQSTKQLKLMFDKLDGLDGVGMGFDIRVLLDVIACDRKHDIAIYHHTSMLAQSADLDSLHYIGHLHSLTVPVAIPQIREFIQCSISSATDPKASSLALLDAYVLRQIMAATGDNIDATLKAAMDLLALMQLELLSLCRQAVAQSQRGTASRSPAAQESSMMFFGGINGHEIFQILQNHCKLVLASASAILSPLEANAVAEKDLSTGATWYLKVLVTSWVTGLVSFVDDACVFGYLLQPLVNFHSSLARCAARGDQIPFVGRLFDTTWLILTDMMCNMMSFDSGIASVGEAAALGGSTTAAYLLTAGPSQFSLQVAAFESPEIVAELFTSASNSLPQTGAADVFLSDLSAGGEEGSPAYWIVKWMSRFVMEMRTQIEGGPAMEKAERLTVAALLWHCGLAQRALDSAISIQKTGLNNFNACSNDLKNVWRTGRKLRVWAVSHRQQRIAASGNKPKDMKSEANHKVTFDVIAKEIGSKASALRQLAPLNGSITSSSSTPLLFREPAPFDFDDGEIEEDTLLTRSQSSTFSIAAGIVEVPTSGVCAGVLDFLQSSNVEAEALQESIMVRARVACVRTIAFQTANMLLTAPTANFDSKEGDGVTDAEEDSVTVSKRVHLLTKIVSAVKRLGFDYFAGVSGCGKPLRGFLAREVGELLRWSHTHIQRLYSLSQDDMDTMQSHSKLVVPLLQLWQVRLFPVHQNLLGRLGIVEVAFKLANMYLTETQSFQEMAGGFSVGSVALRALTSVLLSVSVHSVDTEDDEDIAEVSPSSQTEIVSGFQSAVQLGALSTSSTSILTDQLLPMLVTSFPSICPSMEGDMSHPWWNVIFSVLLCWSSCSKTVREAMAQDSAGLIPLLLEAVSQIHGKAESFQSKNAHVARVSLMLLRSMAPSMSVASAQSVAGALMLTAGLCNDHGPYQGHAALACAVLRTFLASYTLADTVEDILRTALTTCLPAEDEEENVVKGLGAANALGGLIDSVHRGSTVECSLNGSQCLAVVTEWPKGAPFADSSRTSFCRGNVKVRRIGPQNTLFGDAIELDVGAVRPVPIVAVPSRISANLMSELNDLSTRFADRVVLFDGLSARPSTAECLVCHSACRALFAATIISTVPQGGCALAAQRLQNLLKVAVLPTPYSKPTLGIDEHAIEQNLLSLGDLTPAGLPTKGGVSPLSGRERAALELRGSFVSDTESEPPAFVHCVKALALFNDSIDDARAYLENGRQGMKQRDQATELGGQKPIPKDEPQKPAVKALPSGWEPATDTYGRTFFIHHGKKTTTWSNPLDLFEFQDRDVMPDGWEASKMGDGRCYFIDHKGKKTSWIHPLDRPDVKNLFEMGYPLKACYKALSETGAKDGDLQNAALWLLENGSEFKKASEETADESTASASPKSSSSSDTFDFEESDGSYSAFITAYFDHVRLSQSGGQDNGGTDFTSGRLHVKSNSYRYNTSSHIRSSLSKDYASDLQAKDRVSSADLNELQLRLAGTLLTTLSIVHCRRTAVALVNSLIDTDDPQAMALLMDAFSPQTLLDLFKLSSATLNSTSTAGLFTMDSMSKIICRLLASNQNAPSQEFCNTLASLFTGEMINLLDQDVDNTEMIKHKSENIKSPRTVSVRGAQALAVALDRRSTFPGDLTITDSTTGRKWKINCRNGPPVRPIILHGDSCQYSCELDAAFQRAGLTAKENWGFHLRVRQLTLATDEFKVLQNPMDWRFISILEDAPDEILCLLFSAEVIDRYMKHLLIEKAPFKLYLVRLLSRVVFRLHKSGKPPAVKRSSVDALFILAGRMHQMYSASVSADSNTEPPPFLQALLEFLVVLAWTGIESTQCSGGQRSRACNAVITSRYFVSLKNAYSYLCVFLQDTSVRDVPCFKDACTWAKQLHGRNESWDKLACNAKWTLESDMQLTQHMNVQNKDKCTADMCNGKVAAHFFNKASVGNARSDLNPYQRLAQIHAKSERDGPKQILIRAKIICEFNKVASEVLWLLHTTSDLSETYKHGNTSCTFAAMFQRARGLIFFDSKMKNFEAALEGTFKRFKKGSTKEMEDPKADRFEITLDKMLATSMPDPPARNDLKNLIEYNTNKKHFKSTFVCQVSEAFTGKFGKVLLEDGRPNVPPPLLRERGTNQQEGVFNARFKGFASDDYGGPYREAMSQVYDELQACKTPLFIPCGNLVSDNGNNRDAVIPNSALDIGDLGPSGDDFSKLSYWGQQYVFLGRIFALAIRHKTPYPLSLPSLFWKPLALEPGPYPVKDLAAIDEYFVKSTLCFEGENLMNQGVYDSESYNSLFEDVLHWDTKLMSGQPIELRPGGANQGVAFEETGQWVQETLNIRLNEFRVHANLIRKGMEGMLPMTLLALFTGAEFEKMIVGSKTIDVDRLKKHTKYGVDVAESDKHIKFFWNVFTAFTDSEKRQFLRFVWGRELLPVGEDLKKDWNDQKFTIHRMNKSEEAGRKKDDYCPAAHTCFFSIELPRYSSERIMKAKLMFAMTNCSTIDGDADTAVGRSTMGM